MNINITQYLTFVFCFYMLGLTHCTSTENARAFKVDQLINYVCQGYVEASPKTNVCGEKSVWLEADSGVIAYLTVYGVSNLGEARSILDFVKK